MPSPGHKKKKNVVIFSSIFSPHVFGGGEIAACNRAELLASRGHNVSVVTIKEKDVSSSRGELSHEGLRIFRLKMPRRYTLHERTDKPQLLVSKLFWHMQDYFDYRNRRLVNDILDEISPDHVYIDNIIGLGFNMISEIGCRNIPVTYVLHDLNLACFHTSAFHKGKNCEHQCFPCRIVSVLRQAPLAHLPVLGFISPSHANLERMKILAPLVAKRPSRVIRNIPDNPPPKHKRRKLARTRLLFAGRLDPLKGIDFLLCVLEGFSSAFDFHLTVLGTGPMERELRAKYEGKGWVTFRGFVTKEEVASEIIDCDLYCMPSVGWESYGLTTAQALQTGTPVIGSNLGGTAELVRDGITGRLVSPGNSQDWNEAFREIFSKPSLLHEWHKKALYYSSEFSRDSLGEAYENFMEELSANSLWARF